MMKYMIVLDQGTTSTRAIIFNEKGLEIAKDQEEFRQIYPEPGYVEHDPIDILSSARSVISAALTKARLKYSDLLGIAIANQRETVVLWDRVTGEPVYNAIVWQCRRTSERCLELKQLGYEKIIRSKTGLRLDSYFSASKIEWVLNHIEKAQQLLNEKRLLVGTIDTYLMWQLSGGKIYATDYTNASRTMLYNIHELCWDKELCELFHIPLDILPEVYPSSHVYGYTDKDIMGFEIPFCAVAGDQQSALFGQCCFNTGDLKVTYGTGCFLLMNTGNQDIHSKNGLITTLNCQTENQPSYALEGSVFVGGALIQWLRDEMKLIDHASETEKIAYGEKSSNGVYIVPAFVGLGAPYWNFQAEGTITGITRGTTRAHIIRASLESIAFEVNDIIQAMLRDLSIDKIGDIKVDGGAVANNFLMAFQADILNAKILRPLNKEVTALGAFFLGGLAMKLYHSLAEIKAVNQLERSFEPTMLAEERFQKIAGWEKAIRKACTK